MKLTCSVFGILSRPLWVDLERLISDGISFGSMRILWFTGWIESILAYYLRWLLIVKGD